MDNIKFGKFIREVRREKGMTQKELAEQLYVSDKAVSKWENGLGFPDIKLLEKIAECLGISILELIQSERNKKEEIPAKTAEELLRNTIVQSEQMKIRKQQLWKVRLLMAVSICCIGFLLYESGSPFSLWIGGLSLFCGGGALWLLWRTDRIRRVNTGRHWIKNLLTILMDIIVVILLHTYLSFIANNGKQLEMLPEAIPVNAYISNIDGTLWEGIDIDDDIVHGLQESEYVKNLYMKTLFKGTFLPEGKEPDHDAMQAKLFLMGINDMKAIGGIEEDDIVWNKGMDGEIFKDSARRCVVSREILDAYGWELGQTIGFEQFYYVRTGLYGMDVTMENLNIEQYEIAGYVDIDETELTGDFTMFDLLVPLSCVHEAYHQKEVPFGAHSASFVVGNSLQLNEFKQEMKELGLRAIDPMAQKTESYCQGNALNVNDSVFISTATQLRRIIDLSKAFFPAILFLIICVGYLATLLLLQSRKKEMALLRSLGFRRKQCFGTYFAEQLLLVVAGIAVGSLMAVLLQGNYGMDSVLAGCCVGICYMTGNSLALWRLLKISVMDALFTAE